MSGYSRLFQLAQGLHALTGRWNSGDTLARHIEAAGSREELLASGILELGWLDGQDGGDFAFRRVVGAAMIPSPPLGQAPVPSSGPSCALSVEQLQELAVRVAEAPTAKDPLNMLRDLGARTFSS